jgi:hypothetical protein
MIGMVENSIKNLLKITQKTAYNTYETQVITVNLTLGE